MADQLKEEDRLVCLYMHAGWFLSLYSTIFLLFYYLALFIPLLCVLWVETILFSLTNETKSLFLKHQFCL